MRFWNRADLADLCRGSTDRLVVLAYHRVGDPGATAFDPWVVTVDAAQLEAQLRYFQAKHRIVGLDEALAIASGRQAARGTAILLSFDDGYRDNHDLALPVLRALDAPAVFFVVSGFLSGEICAWWDRMAWLVKTARVRRFTVPTAGGDRVIDLRNAAAVDAVKTILTLYKACPAAQTARFAAVLENAERIEPAPPHEPLYMGAAEARALHAAGMAIAAHSHTHPILARLDAGAQRHELQHCRGWLEAAIGAPVDVLAYPVGGRGDFDSTTQQVARDCGYRAAFSCHGGINRPGRADPYDIKRVPVYWGAKPRQLLRG